MVTLRFYITPLGAAPLIVKQFLSRISINVRHSDTCFKSWWFWSFKHRLGMTVSLLSILNLKCEHKYIWSPWLLFFCFDWNINFLQFYGCKFHLCIAFGDYILILAVVWMKSSSPCTISLIKECLPRKLLSNWWEWWLHRVAFTVHWTPCCVITGSQAGNTVQACDHTALQNYSDYCSVL